MKNIYDSAHMKVKCALMCLGLLVMASFANGNATNDLYCIVDVFGGPQAAYYPVSYTNVILGRCWSDDYKTSKIVLKKVVADSVKSKGVSGDGKHQSYYLGVFEIRDGDWTKSFIMAGMLASGGEPWSR